MNGSIDSSSSGVLFSKDIIQTGRTMPRKLSPSQFKSKLRQLESKQKQAVRDFNRAIDKYNREARAHNARVKASRSRINSELAKLQRRSTTTTTIHYTVYTKSTYTLNTAYARLAEQSRTEYLGENQDFLLGLAENENANSLEVTNAILGDEEEEDEELAEEDLQTTAITTELSKILQDLDNRWRGAIFALSSQNPDAARHFCTSAREIFTQIFDVKAPDKSVFNEMPNCEKTKEGSPTRRAKIKFWLSHKGIVSQSFEDVVEKDIENILELFHVLNTGTHGSSGKYSLSQLFSIKTRVEDGIIFLANVVG
jgi:hypothetical protein